VIVGGILYGALVAWRQDDVKKLVAYSSVAHMGFVMLGLAAATQASVQGAILQMVNHGLSTGALFLLVGVIYDRRHTRSITQFGGLATVMPVYAAVFLVVTFSSIGLPGTNGFVGEFMVILGTFASRSLGDWATSQAVFACAGVILAAIYMLSVVQRMFFGPITNDANRSLPDLTVRESIALAPTVVLIFVIGLFPSLLLNQMNPSVGASLEQYRNSRIAYQEMSDESTQAVLLPRRGGPMERGYPEPPRLGTETPLVAKSSRSDDRAVGVQ
jgi:NADH-quinone oxidoreductase subunit M